MPKIIELTVEVEIQKVSCPGVWLCQDGRVSLTVFALGTNFQTCVLPPVFPLLFKDVFYFKKRFQEMCAVSNICCLLKDETIYCELVQWSDNFFCQLGEGEVLAQYLGNLSDVLFPPNMCSNDGVDLLMRRSKEFPGILSPKIEIATKVRIDEVWDFKGSLHSVMKANACQCSSHPDSDKSRQKQVCHSAQYHRNKCTKKVACRSRSHSASRSCSSLTRGSQHNFKKLECSCGSSQASQTGVPAAPRSPRRRRRPQCPQYSVYKVQTPHMDDVWRGVASKANRRKEERDRDLEVSKMKSCKPTNEDDGISLSENENRTSKVVLESSYIDQDYKQCKKKPRVKTSILFNVTPCICEICKKYHDLFHANS